MVNGVAAPEPTRPMRRTVVPVIAELLTNEANQPATPMVHRQSPESVSPEPVHCIAPEHEWQQPAQRILTNEKIGHRHTGGLPVVAMPAASHGKHQSLGQ